MFRISAIGKTLRDAANPPPQVIVQYSQQLVIYPYSFIFGTTLCDLKRFKALQGVRCTGVTLDLPYWDRLAHAMRSNAISSLILSINISTFKKGHTGGFADAMATLSCTVCHLSIDLGGANDESVFALQVAQRLFKKVQSLHLLHVDDIVGTVAGNPERWACRGELQELYLYRSTFSRESLQRFIALAPLLKRILLYQCCEDDESEGGGDLEVSHYHVEDGWNYIETGSVAATPMNTNSVPRSQVDVIKNASSQILDSLKRLELTVYTPKYPNLIRAHAKLRLGIDNHVPPGEWPTADPDITQQLTTDEGFRGKPQMKDLRLDWDIPGITLWSQWIAALFEADFVYEYSMGSFPDLSSLPQAGYVAQIFLAHVKGWKSVRLEAKKDTGNRQYRHSARKQKFRARQRLVESSDEEYPTAWSIQFGDRHASGLGI
ncbi:hypothetical protein M408DRAFT_26744 [Serendipita vermifera MAFF 305830]|uniref:Uncharacterized protein n=1 Tax=Serendipita vermifera MAFF 305830 TaxID=933852 RepID=A0A0C2X665_SERVB|nr:hypothetical protein M408DRAFT_26744 [Serendipita vermifera MAFF 305830]